MFAIRYRHVVWVAFGENLEVPNILYCLHIVPIYNIKAVRKKMICIHCLFSTTIIKVWRLDTGPEIEKNVQQGKKIKEIIFVQSNYCNQFSCEQFVIHFM